MLRLKKDIEEIAFFEMLFTEMLPLMVTPRYFESVFVVDEVVVSNWCYARH